MADAILFNEGRDHILDSGLPATVYFGISTNSIDSTSPWAASDTLASLDEATGTGYDRIASATPAIAAGEAEFDELVWETEAATDWPSGARSIFAATSADGSGKLLGAWNLLEGGGPRDLSDPSTTLRHTITIGPLALAA